jgi:ADP-heptose:LPS heptosyltransferase
LGVPVRDRGLAIDVPETARRRARELFLGAGAPIVVVPGASCEARRPPIGLVADAVTGLQAETGRAVVVLGTAAERPAASAIAGAVPGAVSLAGRTTFVELAAVIERAGVVLCANSASMHLADALRRPVVVLFSGTDLESQWAPRQTASVVLRRETTCRPCYRFDCPFALACLDLDPAAIVEAGLALLDAPDARRTLPTSELDESWIATAS